MIGGLFLVVVASGLVAAVLAGVAVYLFTGRLPLQGRRMVVNLTDGSAIRGVLTEQRGAWLVLHDADLLRGETGTTVRVDGVIYLERPRVLFVQVLP